MTLSEAPEDVEAGGGGGDAGGAVEDTVGVEADEDGVEAGLEEGDELVEEEGGGVDREPPVDPDDVCVLIPTLNEAATIAEVIEGFHELGFENVLVMDGGSRDATREIAREHGARVEVQSGSGKGQAFREALGLIDKPYVVMIDGDGTYLPDDVFDLLQPVADGFDHVIGDRLGNREAFTRLNYVGNHIFNTEFHLAHGHDLRDILSGYRAFRLESARRMRLEADGFGIETEMSAEAVRLRQRIAVVDVRYRRRPSGSEEKLHPVFDGARIGWTVYRTTKTANPGFYFGVWGFISLLAAVASAGYTLQGLRGGFAGAGALTVTLMFVLLTVVFYGLGALGDADRRRHAELLDELR